MGNVNVTATPRNTTNGTNYSIPTLPPKKNKPEIIPPFRGPQKLQAIESQIIFLLFLVLAALTINIFLTILLQKKFKSLPYVMLQNIVVVDMLTPLLCGPLFIVGLILDQYGLILQNLCNIQGFCHSALSTVFLNTVSLVAISRCLAVLNPSLYHKIFVNKIIVRLLLLTIWSTSALLCVPPMNYKEGWGAYRRLEMTCWLAWLPDQQGAMAYNVIFTLVTLGIAFTSSLLAAKVVFSAGSKVMPSTGPELPKPPPYPGSSQQSPPLPTDKQAVILNTEVFSLCSAMFVLYILLWIPLTVMHWAYLKDWRDLNYRVTIAFIFLFLSRSLFNPILYFVMSHNIRRGFVSLYMRCKCRNDPPDYNHVEL